MRGTWRQVLQTGAHLASRVLLYTFAAAVVASLVVVVVLPRATQGAAMTVLTGSMSPEIPVGSVILVRPVDPRALRVGDVATYQVKEDEKSYITHRIVKIHDDPNGLSFTFKGDANRGPDREPVSAGAIRGEVWFHVPYLGAIRDALHGKGGVALLLTLLLAGYAISQLSGAVKERRSGRREGTPDIRAGSLTIERKILVAELSVDPDGPSPEANARSWGATLLTVGPTSYALLIAPPDEGVAAAIELLQSQRPISVQIWEAPTKLVGTSAMAAFSQAIDKTPREAGDVTA